LLEAGVDAGVRSAGFERSAQPLDANTVDLIVWGLAAFAFAGVY
jgi:hypothetical protein